MTITITQEEVANHSDANDGGYWVVVEGYVPDLSEFLAHHPAGTNKIIQRKKKSIDITSNFIDHFGHTVRSFRDACSQFDKTGHVVVFSFQETDKVSVKIIGKVV